MFLRLTIHFMAITFREADREKTREQDSKETFYGQTWFCYDVRFSKSLIQSWQIWALSVCVYGPLTLYNYASLFSLSGPRTTLENYWTPRQWHGIVRERNGAHIEDPREIYRADRKVKKVENVNFIVQAVSLVPRDSTVLVSGYWTTRRNDTNWNRLQEYNDKGCPYVAPALVLFRRGSVLLPSNFQLYGWALTTCFQWENHIRPRLIDLMHESFTS